MPLHEQDIYRKHGSYFNILLRLNYIYIYIYLSYNLVYVILFTNVTNDNEYFSQIYNHIDVLCFLISKLLKDVIF